MEQFYQSILQAKEYAKKSGIDLRDDKKFMGVMSDLSGNSCTVECGWLRRAMERGLQLEFIGSSKKPINQKKQIVGKVRTKLISEEGFNDKAADTILIALMMLGEWQEDYYRDFAVSYTKKEETITQQTTTQQTTTQQQKKTPPTYTPPTHTPPNTPPQQVPPQYMPPQKSNNTVIIGLCVLIGIVAIGILWMSMQMRSQSDLASNSGTTTTAYDIEEELPTTTTAYEPPTTTTAYEPPTTTTVYEPPTTTEYIEPENPYQSRLDQLYEEYWSASDSEMGACYSKSDNLLNEIYQEIRSNLGKESSRFQSLRLDELDWIDERDAAADSSSDYTGTMTSYTLDRCQYLLDYYY